MSCDLSIGVEKDGDSFTITASGEVDLSNSENLVSAARLALNHTPCAVVTLDLGGLTFMDCTGLSALFTITSDCKERSAPLTITNAPACLRRLVETLTLDGALPLS